MASVSLSKSQKHIAKKTKRLDEESDKEWTPSDVNESIDSYTKSAIITVKMENSDVKSTVQTVWSIEDEMAILQGYLDYSSLNNVNPSSNYAAFLTFVKDRLQFEPTKNQLQDKLRRLKKKYGRNVTRRSFSKPHEEKIFKLSKEIWGSSESRVDKSSERMNVGDDSSDLVLSGGSAADLEDWFRRNPCQLISNKDRNEMLEKSQSMKIAKAQQYLAEVKLMEGQAKMAIDSILASLK